MKGPPHPHPISKAGQVVTDENGEGRVVFTEPFDSPGYSICLCCQNSTQNTIIAMWEVKLRTGFDVKTENDKGQTEGEIAVDWMAIYFGNHNK